MQRVPRANESSLVLSLLVVAGISASVTVSGDEDVGEVDEVEELVEKQVQFTRRTGCVSVFWDTVIHKIFRKLC